MEGRSHALETEYRAIRTSDDFRRAPVQARLLEFLYESAISGRARPLTQRDIAIEGLGRSESFDETADSYVRVQISRLRKALRRHYSVHSPISEGCIYIAPGSYELKIGSLAIAYPKIAQQAERRARTLTERSTEDQTRASSVSYRRDASSTKSASAYPRFLPRKVFFAGGLAGIALLLVMAPTDNSYRTERESALISPPTVKILTLGSEGDEGELAGNTNMSLAEQQAQISIASSPVVRSADNIEAFDLMLTLRESTNPTGEKLIHLKVADAAGKNIHQRTMSMPDSTGAVKQQLQWELSSLVAPSGSIARHISNRIGDHPATGYECFVKMERVRSEGLSVANLRGNCRAPDPSDEYYPYYMARELFGEFQKDQYRLGYIRRNTKEWRIFNTLLSEHPGNPFVAAVASKVLAGRGDCANMEKFGTAFELFAAGHPALYTGMLVEALGCAETVDDRTRIAENLVAIHEADIHQGPLMQFFLTSGLIAIDRKDLVREMAGYALKGEEQNRVVEITHSLQSTVKTGRPFTDRAGLRAIIWNPRVREEIISSLARQ